MDENLLNSVRQSLRRAADRLLDQRAAEGCWRGELASSALATATAVFALDMRARRGGNGPAAGTAGLVRNGVRWLVEHQNPDGGWGDTVRSVSNISTTALCWATMETAADVPPGALERARGWLAASCGSLEPRALAQAIAARYGRDRTFSVPILTMCALAGVLGSDAWSLVPQLPFELAALPHRLFSALRLPVVSYALPALIAMGQARHAMRRSANPVAAVVRDLAAAPTMRVLRSIQPAGGGFLEATPLTAFVTMCLAAIGRADDAVARRAAQFLVRSARADGSWPIDTDLATWLTTMSISALAPVPADLVGAGAALSDVDRSMLIEWLLRQQHTREHPYTHAAPGGWAWTDLNGGVPDADDTAGALVALAALCGGAGTAEAPCRTAARRAARAGVRWLLDLQNRDGGIPTFCRGWTNLPFDRSGADLTAHALLAWNAWREAMPDLAGRIAAAQRRAVRYLAGQQRADGAFVPLWFGNQHAPGEENPVYGTARVLMALAKLLPRGGATARAAAWLLSAQNADGGWGGAPGVAASIEETALAVHALAGWGRPEARGPVERGARWLVERTDGGRSFDAAPIGLYFARLWYFEKLYPLIFAVGALARVCGAATASS